MKDKFNKFFKSKEKMDEKKNKDQENIQPQDNLNASNDSFNEEELSAFINDDSLPGTAHLNDAMYEEDESQLEQLEQQIKEANDKYLRLAAEFDNFRKRNVKERIELIKNASEDIIKSLLEVLDDGERALNQIETSNDVDQIKNGITLVFNKLKNTLQQKGLQEMESKGNDFDPDKHEAIAEVPAPDKSAQGKVLDEVSKGYLLNDKIIRHAKVVVGR